MAVCESLLVFLETRDAEVHCQLKQLEQHADREADPDPERAPDGRDEGGDGVPGRLRDGLHVVVLHLLPSHCGREEIFVSHLLTGRAALAGSLSNVVLHDDSCDAVPLSY